MPNQKDKRREEKGMLIHSTEGGGGLHHERERQEWTLRSVHNSVDSYRAFGFSGVNSLGAVPVFRVFHSFFVTSLTHV